MNFEEQLLIGGLLMAIAVLSASHAHARPVAARVTRAVTICASCPRGDSVASSPVARQMARLSGLSSPGSRRHM